MPVYKKGRMVAVKKNKKSGNTASYEKFASKRNAATGKKPMKKMSYK